MCNSGNNKQSGIFLTVYEGLGTCKGFGCITCHFQTCFCKNKSMYFIMIEIKITKIPTSPICRSSVYSQGSMLHFHL